MRRTGPTTDVVYERPWIRRAAGGGRVLRLASVLVLAACQTAQALVSTPFRQTDLALATTSTVATHTVDLSTLPERPRLIVEAIPDASHGDMTIELKITGCTVFNGGGLCEQSVVSPATPGPQSIAYGLFACELGHAYPAYVGQTCDVSVRAVDFGTNPGPATVDLQIRGQTVVPTSTTTYEVSSSVQTVSIEPVKDTTIYQPGATSNNGRGVFLSSHHIAGSDRRNSLFAFDVPAAVPAGATIVGASVEVELIGVTDAPILDLFAVPRDPSTPWFEGMGISPDGFIPPLPPSNFAATWTHRRWESPVPVAPWSTAGGDRINPSLVSLQVELSGRIALSSPALSSHVQALHSGSASFDGLLLTATNGGVQILSREYPSATLRPKLVIQYSPPPISGFSQTGTLNYFSEGQNFRWVYDVDNDNVLITPIAGRCAMTSFFSTNFNFNYQYQGSSGYAGLDCCTWQIGSPTGVTGAGQAIFFVNVSSTNPAYQPADYDTDGIKDLCDACPSVPNGPLLGSCSAGPKIGKLCRSNQECGSGGVCSLAQDDSDRIAPANACVPEPSIPATLAIGLLVLAALERKRSIRA